MEKKSIDLNIEKKFAAQRKNIIELENELDYTKEQLEKYKETNQILNKNVVESDEQLIEWNMTIIDLTNNMLNCTIGNEVLQSQDYFLNLKSFYLSLSDCNYLKLQLMKTLHMKTVAEKKNLLEE